MKTNTVTSITEFIESIKSIKFGPMNYGYSFWFRAESASFTKTSLTPNLFREYIIGPSATVEFYKKEGSLMTIFRNEAFPFLMQNNLIDNELGTSFVMQHYGSHTRLLDWTENSLISLFFAVENLTDQNDAIIWILDPYKLNSSTKKFVSGINVEELILYPSIEPDQEILRYFEVDLLKAQANEVKLPIALKPFYIDDRMKRQSSCFTLFGHKSDGLRQHPYAGDFLQKIIIPFRHFREIKRDLYLLGFSYDSVYPGLEGISKKTVYAFDEYFI